MNFGDSTESGPENKKGERGGVIPCFVSCLVLLPIYWLYVLAVVYSTGLNRLGYTALCHWIHQCLQRNKLGFDSVFCVVDLPSTSNSTWPSFLPSRSSGMTILQKYTPLSPHWSSPIRKFDSGGWKQYNHKSYELLCYQLATHATHMHSQNTHMHTLKQNVCIMHSWGKWMFGFP